MGVAELAVACSMSRRSLEYLFQSTFRTSPRAYLEMVRIERAKDLLGLSQLDGQEIARRVGFKRSSYFTEIFKRRVGLSPGAYRRERRVFRWSQPFGPQVFAVRGASFMMNGTYACRNTCWDNRHIDTDCWNVYSAYERAPFTLGSMSRDAGYANIWVSKTQIGAGGGVLSMGLNQCVFNPAEPARHTGWTPYGTPNKEPPRFLDDTESG